jgi:putative oxidoreductase
MAGAFLIGRVILGAYYLMSAFHHFSDMHMMSRAVAAHGIPMPEAAVATSGALLAFAGLTLLLGVIPRLGVAALVLFFVPVSFTMHAFWTDRNPAARMIDMINFTKNMALLGSSLMFLAIPEPWPYSLGARMRTRLRLHRAAV